MINVDLTLTWDFFVIVFFAIFIAHGFIVGKHHSMRVIISAYIAIIATEGVARFLTFISGDSQTYLSLFGINLTTSVISTISLFVFATCVILIAARGGLDIVFSTRHHSAVTFLLTALFGFATAGLMLSSFIVIVSGGSVFSGIAQQPLLEVMEKSRLIRAVVVYQPIWLTVPAIMIALSSMVGRGHHHGHPHQLHHD